MKGTAAGGVVDERVHAMLQHSFGEVIAAALKDDSVTDIEVNYRGDIHIIRAGQERTGAKPDGYISPNDAETIIRLVASAVGAEAGPDHPLVAGELPVTGERFQGMLPPVTIQPSFAIRKPARMLFSLDQYVERGILSAAHKAVIEAAVAERKNIMIGGGTGSGKTTLANALLMLPAFKKERSLLLQDQDELRLDSSNHEKLFTKPAPPIITIRDLVRIALRLHPDNISVGEVRDGSALELLRAWNTGHEGGLGTVHCNNATDLLLRLEDLCSEVSITVPRRLIATVIHLIVYIKKTPAGRRVTEVLQVDGLRGEEYLLTPL